MQLNPSGQIEVNPDATILSDQLDESDNLPEHNNDTTLDLTNSSNIAIVGESHLIDHNDSLESATDENASSPLTEQNLANHNDEMHEDVARVIKVITTESPPSPISVTVDQRLKEQVNVSEVPLVEETFVSAIDESLLIANGTANGYNDDTKYDDFEQVEQATKSLLTSSP